MEHIHERISVDKSRGNEKPVGLVKIGWNAHEARKIIPAAMLGAPRWVAWKYEQRDGRPTKVPLNPQDGRTLADSTDKRTWSDFDSAMSHVAKGADGVGFVLGDGWGGIDFDESTDERGQPSETLQRLLGHLRGVGAYTERSPSGVGLKTILRIDEAAAAEGLLKITGKNKATGAKFMVRREGLKEVEVYFTGRYFTITAAAWGNENGNEFTPGTDAFLAIARDAHGLKFRNERTARVRTTTPLRLAVPLTDEEVISIATKAANGDAFRSVYENADGTHPSPSEGDLALANYLAFYCGVNGSSQVERIMLASPRVREKFTAHPTYLATTVEEAFRGRTEFYDPTRNQTSPSTRAKAETEPLDLLNEFTIMQNFVDDYRSQIIHTTQGRWFVLNPDSGVLQLDTTEKVFGLATDSVDKTLNTCVDCERDRARFSKAQVVGAVLKLARSRPGMTVDHTKLDADNWLVGTPGGVLNLLTGTIKKGTIENLVSKSLVATPAAAANETTCPNWLAFLRFATKGDDEKLGFIQRHAGYCLTGDVTEHAFVMFVGRSGTGKSTYVATLQHVLHNYAITMSASVLADGNHTTHATNIASLIGARLATASEFPEGGYLNESRLKRLTGDERVRANYMRQDEIEFTTQSKIVAHTNHRPRLRDTSDAMGRRLMVVCFEEKPATMDGSLKEKLRAESPGILAWMIDGLREYLALKAKHGLGLQPPRCVSDPTQAYIREEDLIGEWFNEGFLFQQSQYSKSQGFIATETLLASWRTWAAANSSELHVDGKKLAEWLNLNYGVGSPIRLVWNGKRARGFYGITPVPKELEPLDDGCSD